jgi:excinuclease UvrABC nuclease subunit
MKKSRFRPAYKANGRTNYPNIQGKTGVYIIKKDETIVYIGHSTSDLYKTLYRHFQSWNDKTQVRTVYPKSQRNKYTVRVVLTSKAKAPRLEKALICKYQPKDNPQKYTTACLSNPDKKAAREYFNEGVSYSKEFEPAPF